MNHSQSSNPPAGESRRSFIRKTAGVAATVATANLLKTPVYGQSQAPSSGRVIGANDRIVVGYVGVGSQGTAHLKFQKAHAQENNIAQAAVCDVYQKRLQAAKGFLGLTDAAAYGDHRKLLDRHDIDAVLIATVDDWHAQVSIDALDAGNRSLPCRNVRTPESDVVVRRENSKDQHRRRPRGPATDLRQHRSCANLIERFKRLRLPSQRARAAWWMQNAIGAGSGKQEDLGECWTDAKASTGRGK